MAHRYPIGIQTFSEIIKNDYVYVDKTDLVWQLAHYAKYIFLSRPRRFGKSLLTTTLASYFRGERELFEGLKIMQLEKEWNEHPVIHLSLRAATAEGFYEYTLYLIFSMLNVYVRTQVKCAGGRVDMVVWMPNTIYVFELKTNGTAQDALQQIDSHDYAIPHQTDGRTVVKVGVRFDVEKRVPEDWIISQS